MSYRYLQIACGLLAVATAIGRADDVDFSRDIRPIFSGRCFKCHGPDEGSREGNLRLDQRQAAIDYAAIVPGAPDESTLFERITSDDPDLRMPPGGEPLAKEQINAIRRWIEAGAKYEQHWAYVKPQWPELPEYFRRTGTPAGRVHKDSRARVPDRQINAIDYFVQRRLAEHDL